MVCANRATRNSAMEGEEEEEERGTAGREKRQTSSSIVKCKREREELNDNVAHFRFRKQEIFDRSFSRWESMGFGHCLHVVP